MSEDEMKNLDRLFPVEVPVTDEQVRDKIAEYRNEGVRSALGGIYFCKRHLGSTVLEAWEYTLRAHLGINDEKEEVKAGE